MRGGARVTWYDGLDARQRFGATELHVILNFFEELKARVPN